MEEQKEPDYTEIRDDAIRSKICELMSEMLDNPDEHGIYPTSRFMWRMETYCMKLAGRGGRPERLDLILDEVGKEVERAGAKYAPFNSAHEGYGLILEELDELWDAIKNNKHMKAQWSEAIQVAAMAVRFCFDSPPTGKTKKEDG